MRGADVEDARARRRALIAEAQAAAGLAEPFTLAERRDVINAAVRKYLYGAPISLEEEALLKRWGDELAFMVQPARR